MLQGLFRKVLLEEVSPELLVQMSPEELASEELTHWREQAMKKVCVCVWGGGGVGMGGWVCERVWV